MKSKIFRFFGFIKESKKINQYKKCKECGGYGWKESFLQKPSNRTVTDERCKVCNPGKSTLDEI
jgi:hypothetical protein